MLRLCWQNAATLETLEGANPPALLALINKYGKSAEPKAVDDAKAAPEQTLDARLTQLVRAAPVMVFIKGTPDAPRCGFSRQLVELLKGNGAEFGHFDILSDETVRQGLKTFSNWPTYPQLYIDGKLVGGLDIAKELAADGQLKEMLPAGARADPLIARLQGLINKAPVM